MVNSSCEGVKDGAVVRQPVEIQPGKTIAERDGNDKKIRDRQAPAGKRKSPPLPL